MTLEKEITEIVERGGCMLKRVFDSSDLFGRFAKRVTDGTITFTIIRKYCIFPDAYVVRITRPGETPTYEGTEPCLLTATLVCKNKEDYKKIMQYADSNKAGKVIDVMAKNLFAGKGIILPPIENIRVDRWDSLINKLNTTTVLGAKG